MKILNNWNCGLSGEHKGSDRSANKQNYNIATVPTQSIHYQHTSVSCVSSSVVALWRKWRKRYGRGGVDELKGQSLSLSLALSLSFFFLFCKIDLHSSVPGTASKHFHETQQTGFFTNKFTSLFYRCTVHFLKSTHFTSPTNALFINLVKKF